MKKLVTILAVALVSIGVFAQSPQTMSYQAVVRNSSNALVASTTIGMQISILQKSSTGDPVYIEKHSTTTNANGLATIEIGGGTPVSGRFETIDWSSGPYFLKTETDPTGGSSYSISGTSKLLSVPYALYAEKSGKSGSVDPWLTEGNSLTTVGTNFLGTIDSQPLMFKVYNKEAGYIDFDYNKANTGFGFQTLSSNTTGHSNTANGYEALQSNTTGVQNSAIGKLALSANTEGNNNIALGSEALSYNTSGSFNVAAGTSTMRYNTTGNYNTANGIWSLYNNNKGSYNSAYGTSALQSNIDGNNNTAIGYAADVLTGSLKNATAIGNGAKANTSNEVRIGNKDVSSLYFGTANNLATTTDSVPNMFYDFTTGQLMRSTAAGNDSGNHWTLIGNGGAVSDANFIGTTTNVPFNIKVNSEKAGRIDQFLCNTFFGYQSGNAGPTGKWNTAVGNIALRDNTTGHDNTAIGDEALTFNTTGNSITAIGEGALFRNTTGDENTATGYSALGANMTGKSNTANGVQALLSNKTGDNNTAIGLNALQANLGGGGNTATGSASLLNTIGKSNTGFGFSTLSVNTMGSNNTALGYNANVNSVNINNSTVLGANAIATASNEVRIGNNQVSSLYFGTADNLAVTTDSVPNMFYDHTTGQIMRSTATTTGTGGSDDWKLAGNSGTIDGGTYFIGTTDDVPLNFKVNNILAGRIDHQLGNVFFGSKSGIDNTTGKDNTAIGDKALTSNTTGKSNTANGKEALYTNTTGDSNTANGFQALYSNTTGYYNTATGFSALHLNTTGSFNAAFGDFSLASNTTGTENAAIGSGSLYSNTTGYDNSGLGYGSLYANTTGSGNSAFGARALKDNATGSSNSAFGHLSLAQNTASCNSAFGYWSLSLNTTGSYNAAFGSSSLHSNSTGIYNTAVGGDALSFNTVGDNNASLGTFSLHSNTTGSNNSAFGFKAGNNVTTETNLTFIGANAGINASGYNNATAIGSNAIITGSNTIKLGDNNIMDVKTAGTVTAGTVTYPNTLGNAGDVLKLPISGGNAYWSAPASGGSTTHWDLLGNASTVDGTNFIGTTDNVPLNFRINNVHAGRIDKTLENTFFGYLSGNTAVSGTYNTGTGAYSLASTTTGYNNTAFGRGALQLNTTGTGNTATGYSALVQNADGTCNTANGAQALQNNTSGVNNTSMGYSALINNTTGGNNSAIGLNALQANLGGEGNTATGSGALLYNTTGNYNTGVGYGALYSNTTGSNNTALGNNASVDVNNLTNATALGYNARAAGSNNLILGNNDVNVGIGLSGLIPQNKLEINAAPATNASGLRFRQLIATATPVTNPGTGVLTVDGNGDVIYAIAGSTGSSAHTIGEVYGGGTVFYICDNGQHGLIATPADQSTSMRWDNGTSRFTGSTGDGLFAGAMNTTMIVATQIGDPLAGDFAAKVCADYSVTTGGVTYGDWYLPSKYELNLLFQEPSVVSSIGMASAMYYWSSCENASNTGWVLDSVGNQSYTNKSGTYHVRAVRAF